MLLQSEKNLDGITKALKSHQNNFKGNENFGSQL